jgi:hypothetical protein
MKEAFGGMINYVIILTFVVIVTTFVLFGMNYYRAFSVKNKIISTIEAYEGNINNPKLQQKILDYIEKTHYNIGSQEIKKKCTEVRGQGWCYSFKSVEKEKEKSKGTCMYVYEVTAFVNIDLPFFNMFFNSNELFSVSGETKPIKRSC